LNQRGKHRRENSGHIEDEKVSTEKYGNSAAALKSKGEDYGGKKESIVSRDWENKICELLKRRWGVGGAPTPEK